MNSQNGDVFMIEILLAIGIAWWWVYHRKKKPKEPDDSYEGRVDIDGKSYGYVNDSENIRELI